MNVNLWTHPRTKPIEGVLDQLDQMLGGGMLLGAVELSRVLALSAGSIEVDHRRARQINDAGPLWLFEEVLKYPLGDEHLVEVAEMGCAFPVEDAAQVLMGVYRHPGLRSRGLTAVVYLGHELSLARVPAAVAHVHSTQRLTRPSVAWMLETLDGIDSTVLETFTCLASDAELGSAFERTSEGETKVLAECLETARAL